MLRRLHLRDVVLVSELELAFDAGFSVLTGETGAGKSILIDALQLALGGRGDAALVREGCARAEVSAAFDSPAALAQWLEDGGFVADDGRLLLRRSIDAQGKSRAWINGSPATVTQLREAADSLVDIHGQHAWQSLTRPAAVRALLGRLAGVDGDGLQRLWQSWKAAEVALADAHARADTLQRERDRLAWQIGEVDKLAPADGEWDELNARHERLANAQGLLDAANAALQALSDAEPGADGLIGQAIDALAEVAHHDPSLVEVVEILQSARTQMQDAAHTLQAYLGRTEPDPTRLAELDARLAGWVSLARRYHRAPQELPALLRGWKDERDKLDAASDLGALEQALQAARNAWQTEAKRVGRQRKAAAAPLANSVTEAMQHLGMDGGRFEVALPVQDKPQSFGLESVELLVAGHAGSTPRPLAKVASGGELSRLALAIAVSSVCEAKVDAATTLIFDEIDAGIGGTVAYQVGRLMQQLGRSHQVLAVTHLAPVAASADHHFVVSKAKRGKATLSDVQPVAGEARVTEVSRMLGGERLSDTSRAHAQAMLGGVPEDRASLELGKDR